MERVLSPDILRYCPASKISEYKIEDVKKEESCKPLFEGDSFSEGRIKILLLGKEFGNKEEFKAAVEKHVLKEGLMKTEPYKSYTKNGNDGLFYFTYGDYNLSGEIKSSIFESSASEEVFKILDNCSNIFYTIVLVNTEDNLLRSFNSPDKKMIVSVPDGDIINHEMGHSFGIEDEYLGFNYAGLFETKEMTNCASNPSSLKSVLDWVNEDYTFKGCNGKEELIRTSVNSLMRNHYDGYKKFNYLSCLFLVREFERTETLNDEKVVTACKKMYAEGKLQKTDEVTEEDLGSCSMDKKSHDSMIGKDECKKIIIMCSKKYAHERKVARCVIDETIKIIGEKYGKKE